VCEAETARNAGNDGTFKLSSDDHTQRGHSPGAVKIHKSYVASDHNSPTHTVCVLSFARTSDYRTGTATVGPTRNLPKSIAPRAHYPLPEQYIWTAGDITAQQLDSKQYPWMRLDFRTVPHYFRVHFLVQQKP
jgi:hypothetical protein